MIQARQITDANKDKHMTNRIQKTYTTNKTDKQTNQQKYNTYKIRKLDQTNIQ